MNTIEKDLANGIRDLGSVNMIDNVLSAKIVGDLAYATTFSMKRLWRIWHL